jgi:threonine aldolase
MNPMIDLRSDTVTKPTPAMRQAMANAEVGDDVYSEDPTVNLLQERVADMLGKEAALFVPSGSMANQLAIKLHTVPGEEIICEAGGHVFNYETGGPAFLSNVQVHTIPGTRGVITVEDITPAIRSAVYYNPRTALICLENTHNKAGGTIFPLEEMKRIRTFAGERTIALHLDGARLWNASVASGVPMRSYAEQCDTVSVCFSKGLGAPVGSALAGSRVMIERARKFRKIFGGGMRQAGILAAAALYAMEHHLDRLREDHEHARLFAEAAGSIPGIAIDPHTVQTNIIIMDVAGTKRTPAEIVAAVKKEGLLISEMGYTTIRAVTHLDVSRDDVQRAAQIMMRSLKK